VRLQSSEKWFDKSRPREQRDSNGVDEWTPGDGTVDDPADPNDDGKLFVNERAATVLNESRRLSGTAALYNARAHRQP